MKTSVIIPVKSFSKSKSRLNLSNSNVEDLCKLMLEEMLLVISKTELIDDTILVSKDESAFNIGKKFNCIEIVDEAESGVNDAISLADQFLIEHDYDCSVILPQDIPLIFPHDLDTLFAYYQMKKRAIITPSRHFDGTNALLRMSSPSMKTRYDEGSYKYQFEPLKNAQINYSIALIHRIMIDLDNIIDMKHMLKLNIKPSFCSKLETIFSDSN